MPRRACKKASGNGARMSAINSSTGSKTSRHELGLRITDFFNYDYGAGGADGFCKHYFWDISQNLFNNNTSGLTNVDASSFCRVRRVRVYIQPQQGVNPTTSLPQGNASAAYTVNVQTPAVATTDAAAGATTQPVHALNVQVTNVLPQVDAKWKQVFTCDYDATFRSGDKRPFYYKDAQCLFSLQLIDPVDGGKYQSGSESLRVLCKVVIDVDQPVLPIQQAITQVYSNDDYYQPAFPVTQGGPAPKPVSNYAQMDLVNRINLFR